MVWIPRWSMIFSDLASPAEAGFAKAGNRYPPSDQVQRHAFPDHALEPSLTARIAAFIR
jgi:hypothetical protein